MSSDLASFPTTPVSVCSRSTLLQALRKAHHIFDNEEAPDDTLRDELGRFRINTANSGAL
jgi:hypothetical protein